MSLEVLVAPGLWIPITPRVARAHADQGRRPYVDVLLARERAAEPSIQAQADAFEREIEARALLRDLDASQRFTEAVMRGFLEPRS